MGLECWLAIHIDVAQHDVDDLALQDIGASSRVRLIAAREESPQAVWNAEEPAHRNGPLGASVEGVHEDQLDRPLGRGQERLRPAAARRR